MLLMTTMQSKTKHEEWERKRRLKGFLFTQCDDLDPLPHFWFVPQGIFVRKCFRLCSFTKHEILIKIGSKMGAFARVYATYRKHL